MAATTSVPVPSPQTATVTTAATTPAEKVAAIMAFVDTQRMRDKYTPGWFAEVETELRKKMLELERDLTAEIMAAHDVDAGAVEIAGKAHRRVLRAAQTYMTTAGPVTVERWLYRDRDDDSARSVSPMELRLGIIDGFWTAKAAQQALWTVAQMTPQKSEEAFQRIGSMSPSKSSLDRLPKLVGERWEAEREAHEAALRDAIVIPDGAVSVAVSLDGVLAPMEGTRPIEKRNQAAAEGRISKGPVGYREVGCATLAFCDARGDLLGAVRMARAPEPNKRTLKATMLADLSAVLARHPDLKLVKIADGVDDNWSFLADELPPGVEALDFFHASEHLHDAIAAAYGDGTIKTRHRHEELREVLRDEAGGVEKVIRALDRLRKQHPRRDEIRRCAAYFRKHRRRMNYADLRAQHLMIGSGIVEAACKTLVAQRLKLSGMRWGRGAQAILTPRGWDQSERFDEAWALLAATYECEVHVLANVIAFKPPAKTPRRAKRAG
jgi:hypothetical protein